MLIWQTLLQEEMSKNQDELNKFKKENQQQLQKMINNFEVTKKKYMENISTLQHARFDDEIPLADFQEIETEFQSKMETIKKQVEDLKKNREKENGALAKSLTEIYKQIGTKKLQEFRDSYTARMRDVANVVAGLKAEEEKLKVQHRNNLDLYLKAAETYSTKLSATDVFLQKRQRFTEKYAERISERRTLEDNQLKLLTFIHQQKQELEDLQGQMYADERQHEAEVQRTKTKVLVTETGKYLKEKMDLFDQQAKEEGNMLEELTQQQENVEELKKFQLPEANIVPAEEMQEIDADAERLALHDRQEGMSVVLDNTESTQASCTKRIKQLQTQISE